jgi:hypothetical protein
VNDKNPPLLVRRFQGLWKAIGFFVVVLNTLVNCAQAQQNSPFNVPPIYLPAEEDRATGLRLGRFRLHGALGLNYTYDTNVLYSDVNPQSDQVLQVIPGADLVWNRPRFNLLTGYRFTLRNNIKQNIQDDQQHRANLDAKYKLSRMFTIGFTDSFERSSDPADAELPERVGKWHNEASTEFKYVTPAEDLDLALKYTNVYQRYDAELNNLSFYNNKVSATSRFNVSSSFRFLPKSVAMASVEYGQTNWSNDPTSASNFDSKGVNISTGLTTSTTRKLSISGRVGWAILQFAGGPDSSSFMGGTDIQYNWNSKTSFTLGYERSTQVSTFTNYYKEHRLTGQWKWKFARRFDMGAKTRLAFLDFSAPNTNLDGTTRSDTLFQAMYNISYAFLEWGTLRLSYQYDRRDSNTTSPIFGVNSADFEKHQGNVGVDFYY